MSDSVQFVEFFGEQFAVPARMNARLRARFFRVAAEGGNTEDQMSEAAILLDKMIEQSVRPEDRKRFDDLCDREMPGDEELMGFVVKVISASAERPTGRPSDSSGGPTIIEQKSVSAQELSAHPSLQLIRDLEAQGRADKAQFVKLAMQASAS